jgi:hypothetical protein
MEGLAFYFGDMAIEFFLLYLVAFRMRFRILDPAFYPNVDLDPDPGSKTNADPDPEPDQTLKSQNGEF